ncbi:unnamed protein product [Pleuronectes platessa]|uniref:Peroxisome assembly protein 26 n=1 Tax=Pleuronectes platessa TaxID=8262 RepID=A0A9N7UQV7_PLEPL|nr:unnamed protein product [Pleuronectes platessa]
MLEAAAEQMVVHRDFQAAFDTCDRSLQSLCGPEAEDSRSAEFKAGFCTIGIQALAELNQWSRCPPLGPAAVRAPGEDTCKDHADVHTSLLEVAELHLLHVLVPLGRTDEARELIVGEVGGRAFTEDQRRTALEVVDEREQQNLEPPLNPGGGPNSAHSVSNKGAVVHKLTAMLRFLYKKLFMTGSGSVFLRRIFVAAVLVYMLLLRMDPARPSSFLWISKLLELLKQMWSSMVAPYYHSLTQSKGL